MTNLSYAPLNYVEKFSLEERKLFNIKSKKYLAFVLKEERSLLKEISKNPQEFYRFAPKTIEKNGKKKTRNIEEPNFILKPIHRKIHILLSEIPAPDYLFSKKKSSCVLNAKAHVNCHGSTLNIDIENFFPSTSRIRVQQFFGYFLQYPRDVADFMADICTVNNHIPTGSPLSLMLAFWANKPMFDELNKLAASRKIKMTIYVDDISFTGVAVNDSFKNKVTEIVNRYNHSINPDKVRFFSEKLRFINGIAVSKDGLRPSNKLSKEIRSLKNIREVQDANTLGGKLNYMNYIKAIDLTV
ncbi:reverse transcriptase family protein [Acinetobacter johnsonii]|uniref:reverse transcriptase family protein n=1 Tax=Acinetobacter johnsonii TaxID=40214 RepID=UPI00244CEAF1|nr:reverse transcriptase family protein [Acinetobacter johnsonii]MDH1490812.1 reverse transcriptase family protein [Acinetobacter johnsonii]MDH1615891.1 reverse transcriptase family protein [Acinetobacter johnsonii]MDN5625197.1 reverse transcriptase family protein [Acinetobacter sp.]